MEFAFQLKKTEPRGPEDATTTRIISHVRNCPTAVQSTQCTSGCFSCSPAYPQRHTVLQPACHTDRNEQNRSPPITRHNAMPDEPKRQTTTEPKVPQTLVLLHCTHPPSWRQRLLAHHGSGATPRRWMLALGVVLPPLPFRFGLHSLWAKRGQTCIRKKGR
jgi:hypothetical protein